MLHKKIRLFLFLAAMTSVYFGLSAFLSNTPAVPSFAATQAAYRPSEAWLLDRHGEVIAVKRIDHEVRRLPWVGLDEVSPATQELLILSEDRRFYRHGGVDWLALLTSGGSYVWHIFDDQRPRGASTLTMQLAGFLDPALAAAKSKRTLAQKWRQILAAREIEKSWSKREILEAYFNLAAFRGEVVGIHAASFALFGSHPQALSRAQSLLLVALLKGTAAKPEQVARRACALLDVSRHPADPGCAALRELAQVTLNAQGLHLPQDSIAPHLAQKLLRQPGSRVTSTLDAELQRFAMQSLRQHLLALAAQNVRDGAVVVLDNATGEVLAYVGSSSELSAAAQVDGVLALRQAGSTLKPFLYGKAIEARLLTAASVLDDSPLQLNTSMGLYIPQNYDRDFKGAVSLRTALASSLNVPAVRTLGLVGVDEFARTLRGYGLRSVAQDGEHYGFSLALGGVEVSLLELSNAYRALANRGLWRSPKFQIDEPSESGKRVIGQASAFVIGNILADKSARALTFGLENPLSTRMWTAVKTGTSKDMRDNWCIGFSARYTVGVWVGNFDGEPMRDVSGVSGAAPVWRDLMDFLHAGSTSPAPKPPRATVAREIHFSPPIESARNEWFIQGTETDEIKLVDTNRGAHTPAKILSPTDGTVIALDPDIPPKYQRVQFASSGGDDVVWLIDGTAAGNGAEVGWMPGGGKHRLVLNDLQGNELDAVSFEVRGVGAP